MNEDVFIRKHYRSVRVHRVADPTVFYNNAGRIAGELFGMRELQDGARTFSVHPASGYLFYADYGELWRNTGAAGLPADTREAEQIARNFLDTANKKIAGSKRLRQEGIPPLFPSDIRPIWIAGVVPGGTSVPDHCLCQFGVFLTADRERTGRVEGAAIDVRIGRDRKIIGLSSRWRPVTGDSLSGEPLDPTVRKPLYADSPATIRKPDPPMTTPIAKPEPASPPSLEHDHDEDEVSEYLFWLADENAPQTFLAPMLLQRDGHHGGLEAASQHSLYAEIWQRESGAQIEVLAVVYGGSGNYTYQWGRWQHDSVLTEGVQPLGTARTASLDRAVYNVLLSVRDTLTGAVTKTEQVIFPRS